MCNWHKRPQAERDNIHRVNKKSFITKLHTPFFTIKGTIVLPFAIELWKYYFETVLLRIVYLWVIREIYHNIFPIPIRIIRKQYWCINKPIHTNTKINVPTKIRKHLCWVKTLSLRSFFWMQTSPHRCNMLTHCIYWAFLHKHCLFESIQKTGTIVAFCKGFCFLILSVYSFGVGWTLNLIISKRYVYKKFVCTVRSFYLVFVYGK